MTGTQTPEFSRPVLLARVGADGIRREIAASEAECAALARRFGLVALGRLSASIELARHGGDLIVLRARFEADFVQSCVVTLDPVPGAVAEQFTLLYGPPESEATAEGALGDDVAFEPLAGDTVDIGEAVAQEFALALPPFPRSPCGDSEPPAPTEPGPFAGLAHLLARRGA